MDDRTRFVWWPDLWLDRTIAPEEFERWFCKTFPQGVIHWSADIPDFPNYKYFQLKVPLEQKDMLEKGLKAFAREHGLEDKEIAFNAAPEPSILPPRIKRRPPAAEEEGLDSPPFMPPWRSNKVH